MDSRVSIGDIVRSRQLFVFSNMNVIKMQRIERMMMSAARTLLLAIGCLLSLAGGTSAQQVKLKAALQVPITELLFGRSLAEFKKEVEEATRNAVTIEIFDNGKPYTDNQILGAVTSGAMELGVVGFNQFADKMPAIAMLDQPFLFNFDALTNAAFAPGSQLRAVIDKALLDSMGVRVLWWQPIGNQLIYSKGQDVASPRQIKDKKMRVISDTNAKFIKLCGGQPTNMPVLQMNESMKDGRIDMAMSGIAALLSRDMWKVSDTVTLTYHSPLEYLLITTEKTWQALPPAHRAAITDVVKRLEPKIRERAAESEQAVYTVAREKGMKIVELAPHQVAEWRACSSDVLVQYMETSGETGSRLMAAYGRLRTAPCCSAGPPSGNRR
jgi:TRAP-type C4-dicarboxylate transport system substrate-binding protein